MSTATRSASANPGRLRHQPLRRQVDQSDRSLQVPHPRYQKVINRQTVLHVHDEKNETKVGDKVEVMETRPISRLKRWRVVKVLSMALRPRRCAITEQDVAAQVPTKTTKTKARDGSDRLTSRPAMIQLRSILEVADNTGARKAAMISRKGQNTPSRTSATSSPSTSRRARPTPR
jgi:ribosomal protein S17